MDDETFLKRAVQIAADNVVEGGQPFGAVLVRNGKVMAEGANQTHVDCDPTAHAEMQAIRNASKIHQITDFPDSTMYASGIPCAVCMSAMINSGVARVVYCADDVVGEPYGWTTAHLYARMQRPFGNQGIEVSHLPLEEKTQVFEAYREKFGRGPNDKLSEG